MKHKAPGEARHWARELTDGLRAKWVIPVERYWTILSFFTMLFFGPAIGLLVPLRVQSLGWSAAWLGWCEAALSAGMLIGALYAARALTERFGLAACGPALPPLVVTVLSGRPGERGSRRRRSRWQRLPQPL